MSNEITIKIRSDLDATGLKETKKELKDVETASDKAGNAVDGLDRKLDGLKGKKLKVDVEIDQEKLNLPGDQKVKVKVEPDRVSATSFMSKFAGLADGAAGPALKLLGNHAGITVGVAAGVAAAPVLASAIGSALSAGAGAGVIGAGIAFAIKSDKSLQAIGKQAGKDFMENMGEEAKVFAGPIRESFGILEQAGSRVSQKWGEAFRALSGDVVPFVKDVVSGVERISDAFTNVAKSSGGAALEGFGDTFKLLADGVGDFVEVTADGGPKAAANLQLVAGALGDVLRYTGMTLASLNEMASNPFITGPIIPLLRDHYVDAADAAGTFAKRTKGAANEMESAGDAARGEREALEGLSSELKAQADPVFAIVKAQDDLAKAQKETAEATKKHGKNSAEAEAALQKQALAALALEANVGKLGDTFDGKMTPAMRATLRAAKLTNADIDRLESQFGQAKKAGDRFAKTYAALVKANGVPKTINDLNRIRGIVNSMDGRTIDIAMRVTGVSNVSKAAAAIRKQYAHGGITGAANGGLRSGLTWVGEEGPELIDAAPGSRVHSNPDSMRMANNNGGGSGGPMIVQLVMDGKVLAEQLVGPFRGMVNRQAGSNAQQFWGQGS